MRTPCLIKLNPTISDCIEENVKVSDIIIPQNIGTLTFLSISSQTTSLSRLNQHKFLFDVEERIKWKFTTHGDFSIKNSNLCK